MVFTLIEYGLVGFVASAVAVGFAVHRKLSREIKQKVEVLTYHSKCELHNMITECFMYAGCDPDDVLGKFQLIPLKKQQEWTERMLKLISMMPEVTEYNEGSMELFKVTVRHPGPVYYIAFIGVNCVSDADNDCWMEILPEGNGKGTAALYCRRGHYLGCVSVHYLDNLN